VQGELLFPFVALLPYVSMVEGSSEGEVTYVWLTCDA
jgi:hypothetical protein